MQDRARPATRAGTTDVERAHREAHAGRAVLLDVRTPGEFAAGHAPGALSVPLDQLAGCMDEVPEGRPVCVICRSGHRSSMAAARLAAAGRTVTNVEGGMLAWERAGLPVERESSRGRGFWSLFGRR